MNEQERPYENTNLGPRPTIRKEPLYFVVDVIPPSRKERNKVYDEIFSLFKRSPVRSVEINQAAFPQLKKHSIVNGIAHQIRVSEDLKGLHLVVRQRRNKIYLLREF